MFLDKKKPQNMTKVTEDNCRFDKVSGRVFVRSSLSCNFITQCNSLFSKFLRNNLDGMQICKLKNTKMKECEETFFAIECV